MIPFPFGDIDHDDFDPVELATIDEAISALIDDEFDALALEYDVDPAEARARLLAWDGYPRRRQALERATAAITTPVEPLDPATIDALLDGAQAVAARTDTETPMSSLAEQRARKQRRVTWTAALGAAAAAIVLVAFGIQLLDQQASDELATVGASISDSGDTTAAMDATPIPGTWSDVGPLDDPARQSALVATARAVPSATAPPEERGDSGDTAESMTAPPYPCPTAVPAGESVFEAATGTYGGQPVYWIVSHGPAGWMGRVVDPSTCTVLSARS